MAIQMGSRLEVADNSGAQTVMCIKPHGGTGKRHAKVGDVIKISIKSLTKKSRKFGGQGSKVKVGEVYDAVIVTEPQIKRKDGSVIRFSASSVVILDKNYELIGTSIDRPIPREIRGSFPKIISLAPEVL